MKALALRPEEVSEASIRFAVLCQDIVSVGEMGRVKLGKGHLLTAADVAALRAFPGEIHVVRMEEGDIHENEAAIRLARAVAGSGLEQKGPVESQVHLRASHRGVLTVDSAALERINSLPDVSVFTAFDGQPVSAGKAVAAAKITPLSIAEIVIEKAEEIALAHAPVVSVLPFLGGTVGVVVRERLAGANREKFELAIQTKVNWFGSKLAGIHYLPDDVQCIAAAIDKLVSAGAVLVLAAGVNSTDPLDLTIRALETLGAQTEKRGVPAHPGSTCWLSYTRDVPVFGLALCGMFAQTTVLDLLLPRFLAGRSVRAADIATLGHGGLLSKDMTFRFPTYKE